MKVAIVVDGLEATRQFHSDSGESIESATKMALRNFPNFSSQIYRDDQISDLLDNLHYPSIAAVIFASNSLRHPEGKIVQHLSLETSIEKINRFLNSGGGLAILHQFTEKELPIIFPDQKTINYSKREPKSATNPFHVSSETFASDPLLNFPYSIKDEGFGLATQGQLSEVVSWMKLSISRDNTSWLEPTLKSATDEVLIAKSSDGFPWRLVVSAIPLDWHRATPLLANVIRYVAAGKPQVAIWPNNESHVTPAVITSLSESPSSFRSDSAPSGSRVHNWLYRLPILHLFTEKDTDLQSEQVTTILENGGVILQLSIDTNGSKATFTGMVGTRRREIFTKFFRAYAANWSGAPDIRDPFPLRNVVVASSYFANAMDDSAVLWNPEVDTKFRNELDTLIVPNLTITTAFAVLQIFAASKAKKSKLLKIQRILHSLGTASVEDLILLKAASVVVGETSFVDFLIEVAAPRGELQNVHPEVAVRILDWIGFIHFGLDMQCSMEGVNRASLERLIQVARESEVDGVWLSEEGTTSVVIGICALTEMLHEPDLLAYIAPAVAVLRSSLQSTSIKPESAPIELRILHALSILERFSPSILEQIESSLKFVSSDSNSGVESLNATREAQTSAQIALRNRELKHSLNNVDKQHFIYLVGTISVWLLSIIALGVAGGLIILTGSIRVSWASWLVAILSAGWLYSAFFILLQLENLLILPKWLAKGMRRLGKFNKWFPEFNIK